MKLARKKISLLKTLGKSGEDEIIMAFFKKLANELRNGKRAGTTSHDSNNWAAIRLALTVKYSKNKVLIVKLKRH